MACLYCKLSYIHSDLSRTAFCHALMLVLGIFLLSVPAQAQDAVVEEVLEEVAATDATDEIPDDPYTVENIEVDVTADNAVQAREKAFEEAQLKGYETLAKRFLSDDEKESFETPEIGTVSSYVKDFEVTNEKLSAYRYKGTYTIRFSPKTFRNPDMDGLYQNADGPKQGEILIVPFYELNGRHYLWQVNPFLEAWARARSNNVLGKAIVPIGDIDDISQLKDEQGLSYDPARLNAMRLRYRANDVALMIATPEEQPDGAVNVLISLYNAKPYGPELAQQFSVKGYPGELPEQLYNRIVSTVSQALHRGWKRQTAVHTADNNSSAVQEVPLTGPEASLTAQINFSTARDWVETKRSIERARGVKSLQVKSLSPRSAVLVVTYVGDIQNLRTSLQQQGVGLNDPQTQYTQTGAGVPPLYQIYSSRRAGQY